MQTNFQHQKNNGFTDITMMDRHLNTFVTFFHSLLLYSLCSEKGMNSYKKNNYMMFTSWHDDILFYLLIHNINVLILVNGIRC